MSPVPIVDCLYLLLAIVCVALTIHKEAFRVDFIFLPFTVTLFTLTTSYITLNLRLSLYLFSVQVNCVSSWRQSHGKKLNFCVYVSCASQILAMMLTFSFSWLSCVYKKLASTITLLYLAFFGACFRSSLMSLVLNMLNCSQGYSVYICNG